MLSLSCSPPLRKFCLTRHTILTATFREKGSVYFFEFEARCARCTAVIYSMQNHELIWREAMGATAFWNSLKERKLPLLSYNRSVILTPIEWTFNAVKISFEWYRLLKNACYVLLPYFVFLPLLWNLVLMIS